MRTNSETSSLIEIETRDIVFEVFVICKNVKTKVISKYRSQIIVHEARDLKFTSVL